MARLNNFSIPPAPLQNSDYIYFRYKHSQILSFPCTFFYYIFSVIKHIYRKTFLTFIHFLILIFNQNMTTIWEKKNYILSLSYYILSIWKAYHIHFLHLDYIPKFSLYSFNSFFFILLYLLYEKKKLLMNQMKIWGKINNRRAFVRQYYTYNTLSLYTIAHEKKNIEKFAEANNEKKKWMIYFMNAKWVLCLVFRSINKNIPSIRNLPISIALSISLSISVLFLHTPYLSLSISICYIQYLSLPPQQQKFFF